MINCLLNSFSNAISIHITSIVKIDIDSYVNGVFLPNNRNSSAPGLLHTGRHTNDYIERVNAEIVAADLAGGKDAVLKQLDQIRKMLLNGTYTPPQK